MKLNFLRLCTFFSENCVLKYRRYSIPLLENYDSARFYSGIGSLDFVEALGSQHGITKEKTKGVMSDVLHFSPTVVPPLAT